MRSWSSRRSSLTDGVGSRTALIVAFGAVYLIWGSTYLAIRFAIETLPPFLMAGVRFTVAGGILYLWARLRGAERPGPVHWRSALIIGGLLLFIGNGGVVWAEQMVSSGEAALLAGTVPLWMVLLEWARRGGSRPGIPTLSGVGVGMVGLFVLVDPRGVGGSVLYLPGVFALLLASFAWSVGSIYSRGAPLPRSGGLTTAMQMLAGGMLLLLLGTLLGEWRGIEFAALSHRSVLSLLYLIIFGSLIAYSAYTYILAHATPARVSTYAYVNPVVAVLLGWALGGEEVTARTLFAASVIIASVALITIRRGGRIHPASSWFRRRRNDGGQARSTAPRRH